MQRDDVCLLDILDSARIAATYVAAMTRAEFLTDQQCQDAVIRRLEIIGEAARRVSEETRQAHPELPWKELLGQRNLLIHKYDAVDFAIVWETVQKDLPDLIASLEALLPGWETLRGD